MEAIVFMFCITLHNIEEALWFTDWENKTLLNSRRQTEKNHFIFAVLGITVLGYLAAGLFMMFPNNQYLEYIFIGFVGAMLVNAVIPHLFLTIKYKRFCPGVFTGSLLIVPFHIIILCNVVNSHLKLNEIIVSTIIVGVILLSTIFSLKWLAEKIL